MPEWWHWFGSDSLVVLVWRNQFGSIGLVAFCGGIGLVAFCDGISLVILVWWHQHGCVKLVVLVWWYQFGSASLGSSCGGISLKASTDGTDLALVWWYHLGGIGGVVISRSSCWLSSWHLYSGILESFLTCLSLFFCVCVVFFVLIHTNKMHKYHQYFQLFMHSIISSCRLCNAPPEA